ncbi:MAG: hypothetical protein WBC05_01200 [Sedimentisphaerales bacterium]
MQEIKTCRGYWAIILYVLFCFTGGASGIELGIETDKFTIDGKPIFLFGISYYGALGASREYVMKESVRAASRGVIYEYANQKRVSQDSRCIGRILKALLADREKEVKHAR